MNLPVPVVLVALALALLAVVVLWKLLLTAAGIGLALWLLVHAAADSPGVQFLVFAGAGLALAAAMRHLSPFHRPALAGHRARFRAHADEEAVR